MKFVLTICAAGYFKRRTSDQSYVVHLGFEVCRACLRLPRCTVDCAEFQFSSKRDINQARPLTVSEVGVLHQIAADCQRNIIDRVFAFHALMAL